MHGRNVEPEVPDRLGVDAVDDDLQHAVAFGILIRKTFFRFYEIGTVFDGDSRYRARIFTLLFELFDYLALLFRNDLRRERAARSPAAEHLGKLVAASARQTIRLIVFVNEFHHRFFRVIGNFGLLDRRIVDDVTVAVLDGFALRVGHNLGYAFAQQICLPIFGEHIFFGVVFQTFHGAVPVGFDFLMEEFGKRAGVFFRLLRLFVGQCAARCGRFREPIADVRDAHLRAASRRRDDRRLVVIVVIGDDAQRLIGF